MAIATGNIYIPDFQLFVPKIAVEDMTVILSNYADLYELINKYNYEQGTSYNITDFEVGIISKAPRKRYRKRWSNPNATDIANRLGVSGYHSIHRYWWNDRRPEDSNSTHRPKCYAISWKHICYENQHFDFSLNDGNQIINGLFDYAATRNTTHITNDGAPFSEYRGTYEYTHINDHNIALYHVITYLGVIFRLKTPLGYLSTDMSKTTIACIPYSDEWLSDATVKVGPTWGWADCLNVTLEGDYTKLY